MRGARVGRARGGEGAHGGKSYTVQIGPKGVPRRFKSR